MALRQFLSILFARRWVVLSTLVTLFGSAVLLSLVLPRQYSATTQVLVDLKSPDPVGGGVLPAALSQAYLSTQVEVLLSQKVALQVVDRLHLADQPAAIEAWRDATDGRGSMRYWLADGLLAQLDVRPSRDSMVLLISYTTGNPEMAAAVANEVARAYIDTHVAIRSQPARQSSEWYASQIRLLRDRLDGAQRRLTEFQRTKGIVSTDERFDVENSRLQELSSQLVAISALTAESAKRQQLAQESSARGTAGDMPEVLQNPLVQQLKAKQAGLEAKLKELSAVYGRNHPEILRTQQDLEATRARVQQEIGTVASSLSKGYTVAARREAELRAALETQRARVMALKQSRDELKLYERDVESAQRAYDDGMQRMNQNGLESQATQANIVVLNPAVEPIKPSSPNLLLNGLVGLFVGLMFGVMAALLLELADRRVRSTEDLVHSIPGPVIGRVRSVPTKPLLLGHSSSSRI